MRFACLSMVLIVLIGGTALAETPMWVKVDTLNRRTCPSTKCGIVGKLFMREAVSVIETQNGWARITKPYDASCRGGRSDYVDSGNAQCTSENGIVEGRFAEWVSLEMLSADRPADPGTGATGIAKLVARSDHFNRYERQFVEATKQLLSSGRCTEKDFQDMGGWTKSTNKGAGIYFTYCNNGKDRIYLDVSSGRTFR